MYRDLKNVTATVDLETSTVVLNPDIVRNLDEVGMAGVLGHEIDHLMGLGEVLASDDQILFYARWGISWGPPGFASMSLRQKYEAIIAWAPEYRNSPYMWVAPAFGAKLLVN